METALGDHCLTIIINDIKIVLKGIEVGWGED